MNSTKKEITVEDFNWLLNYYDDFLLTQSIGIINRFTKQRIDQLIAELKSKNEQFANFKFNAVMFVINISVE